MPALTFDCPLPWREMSEQEREAGYINSDVCMTGDGDYFIRAVLRLPMLDGPEPTFEFGVWGSLSKDNFERYIRAFEDIDREKLGWMFSYLSNELPDFPGSLSLKAHLHPQNDHLRPLMELEPTDHPLAVAQRDGIQYDRVMEIVHGALG